MRRKETKSSRVDREIALALLAWVLLATPAAMLWATPTYGWLAPFVVWFGLIAGAAGLARRHRHADDD